MQEAIEKTVLGNFADARLTYRGVKTRFFRRGGRSFVNTDGPGGMLADFAIRHTFDVHPRQRYPVERPGGRLQALGTGWDARPKAQGGRPFSVRGMQQARPEPGLSGPWA